MIPRMFSALSIAVCLVALPPTEGERGQADDCTNGFMSVERMNQVVDNYLLTSPWNEQIIAPGAAFTCNGSIKTLMFGAFWRGVSRPQFPEFQIWRPVNENIYELVDYATYTIPQSSLFYQYSPAHSATLHFQSGDIFGFYQPKNADSRLRLLLAARTPQPVQTVYNRNNDPRSTFNISAENRMSRNLMVAIVTDPPGCAGSGFMTNATLRSLLGLEGVGRLVNRDARQQITPDINFTCDGFITKWIIGALRVNDSDIQGPELQLWRNIGNDTYVKINGTFIGSEAYNDSLIYEYTDFSPVPFKSGDVLGIFVPRAGNSRLRLRSEVNNGPLNYYATTERTASVSPYNEIQPSGFSSSMIYHPLVSLEISVSQSSAQSMPVTLTSTATYLDSVETTLSTSNSPSVSFSISGGISTNTAISSTLSTYLSQSPTPSPGTSPSSSSSSQNLSVTDTSEPPTSTSAATEPTPPPGTSPPDSQSSKSSSLGPGIGAGVTVVLLLVVLVAGVTLLLLWLRRKRTAKVTLQKVPTTTLSNPVYEGCEGRTNGIAIHGTITNTAVQTYESPYSQYDSVTNGEPPPPRKETLAEFDNPLYSDSGPVTFSETTLYETTEFRGAEGGSPGPGAEYSYVPTHIQREAMMKAGENIYSTPANEVTKSGESTEYAYVKATAKCNSQYFEESNIYWTPATTVSDLYEQLSQYKYREITREHIEVGESLGSGQFGVVNRGKWLAGGGSPVDVAIKTLRPESREEDKLRFLQEAAINGQFRHPNIVRLHGVVTVGEPVMIVLDFLPNGDLREFLHSLKSHPTPPEQSKLSQLCLSFSRQIASGMSYLAGKDFVHRDLAARNILVSENRVCKVADFGMARDVEEGSYYISRGGKIPVKWTAPEALHYKKYSTASDVWSFGCLMYEIWSLGHKPFEGYTNSQVMNLVTEGYRLAPPPGCPRAIYTLMINCWNPEKSLRPSFESLRQTLSGEASLLLQWREEDSAGQSQAARLLTAPLEAGKDLHSDLQETYLQKH